MLQQICDATASAELKRKTCVASIDATDYKNRYAWIQGNVASGLKHPSRLSRVMVATAMQQTAVKEGDCNSR
jgi:hypothetical protein